MLTGRAPFDEGEHVMRSLLEPAPPSPRLLAPGVPRALEAICLWMLARNPAERFRDAGEVVEVLDRFLGGGRMAG